jgi:hypothetical protein
MTIARAGALVALVLLAPFAAADNVFSDPRCDAGPCVTPAVCADGVHLNAISVGPVDVPPTDVNGGYCQSSACDPALACQGSLAQESACGRNETVDGWTCQRTTSGGVHVGRTYSVLGRSGEVPVLDARASLVESQGNASRRDLRNAWTSDAASVSLAVAGQDLGTTEASWYNSTILLPGSSGGAQALLDPGSNMTYRGYAVGVDHEGTWIVVGFATLDWAPVGCSAGTNAGDLGGAACPHLPPIP